MSNVKAHQQYVALLRGINVGGHHKVPMADLRKTLEGMGYLNVKTLLNSGNAVFEGKPEKVPLLEKDIAAQLEKTFGFPIPVLIRTSDDINKLAIADPFKGIEVHKDIRLYVTFFRTIPQHDTEIPWTSPDGAFKIIEIKGKAVCSVLNVAISKTPEVMNVLGKFYGNDNTTRNWNTIQKIAGMFS